MKSKNEIIEEAIGELMKRVKELELKLEAIPKHLVECLLMVQFLSRKSPGVDLGLKRKTKIIVIAE